MSRRVRRRDTVVRLVEVKFDVDDAGRGHYLVCKQVLGGTMVLTHDAGTGAECLWCLRNRSRSMSKTHAARSE